MRKKVTESRKKVSIKSPQQLDEAIKIAMPGVWAVVLLGILLLAAFLLWASLGNIPTKVSAIAWVEDGVGVMYIPEESMEGIDMTKEVIVGGGHHFISEISNVPVFAEDLKTQLPNEVYFRLNPSPLTYKISFDAEGVEEGAVAANIVIKNERPISFIFKSVE